MDVERAALLHFFDTRGESFLKGLRPRSLRSRSFWGLCRVFRCLSPPGVSLVVLVCAMLLVEGSAHYMFASLTNGIVLVLTVFVFKRL